MDNTQFQTSFIPKKPIMEAPLHQAPRPTQRSVSIFSVVAFFLIVLVGGAYAGLYFYKASLVADVANAKKSLDLARESFEPEAIADLQLFDKRITASKQVLAAHIVVSPFFELLNSLTLPSVQFNKFSLVEGKTQNFVVNMSGQAKDYKSIAIQGQIFNSSAGKYLKNVVFSNLTLADAIDKKGYVTFDVSFTIDPILLSYEKQILKYSEKKKEDVSNLKPLDSIPENKIDIKSLPATEATPINKTDLVDPKANKISQ